MTKKGTLTGKLNRKEGPAIRPIQHLPLPLPQQHVLDNGIVVHEVCLGTQEVIKLEVLIDAGRPYEKHKIVSRAVASLLKEGTQSFDSEAIGEMTDYFGATVSSPSQMDTLHVVLYCLKKHFHELLPLIEEMLVSPTFAQAELDSFVRRNKQRLQVDLQKVDIQAYREITERIFGSEHPYGYNSELKDFDALTTDHLHQHFQDHFRAGNIQIIICGKTDPSIIAALNNSIGQSVPSGKSTPKTGLFNAEPPTLIKMKVKDALQGAIRIGRPLFDRNHKDHNDFFILNTILGGYFGSRLMTNIREKRGYTYNIYSATDTMMHGGYFYIGTEVGLGSMKKAHKEVLIEMDKLCQDLIPAQELTMVQNYLMGNLLNLLDGPFNVSEVIRSTIMEGGALSDWDAQVTSIQEISAERLRDLAQAYFKPSDMWTVMVGA